MRHQSLKEAVIKIAQVCDELGVKVLIIGFVEGQIKSYFDKFVKQFKLKNPTVEIALWDETLTTRQAREWMIKHQVPKTKRKQKEHEVAASIILQSFDKRRGKYHRATFAEAKVD
ncbi:Holliday junction resolvase RuvX [Candidatus Curtissbacteria bacterium]|nr:Holliday junction resolvase RuvX [Candidatus Curtissbacteria bacterium]